MAPRAAPEAPPLFHRYRPRAGSFDEFFAAPGQPRPEAARVVELLEDLGREEILARTKLADATFLASGITFSRYRDGGEPILPFDLLPRLMAPATFSQLELGLVQRVRALDEFLRDVYGEQRILEERLIPRELVEGARGYRSRLRGLRPPRGVHLHVAAVDLIRDPRGELRVLADDLGQPSGVSYVLENRMLTRQLLPRLFARARVRPVEEYPARLRRALAAVAAPGAEPAIVVLGGASQHPARFEDRFLARRLGCELVEPGDLFVEGDRVYVRTTRGPSPVSAIYRRVGDAEPEGTAADGCLGVPGLLRTFARGQVALANAPGNGVADDKALHAFVPDMIRFYLTEEPILPQVDTYVCARQADRTWVLEHLAELVVRPVDGRRARDLVVGPEASRKELAELRERIRAEPRRYVAQPRIELSTSPTWTSRGVEPRRVDLRAFVVAGERPWVLPGGLTRVAPRRFYVASASRDGGAKDTWVLEEGSS